MVDVSHPSKASKMQTIALSKAPVIASHSAARALANHSRNLDDEQLLALKKNGGVMQTVAFASYVKVTGAVAGAAARRSTELRTGVRPAGRVGGGRGGRGGRGGGRGRGAAAAGLQRRRTPARRRRRRGRGRRRWRRPRQRARGAVAENAAPSCRQQLAQIDAKFPPRRAPPSRTSSITSTTPSS